MTNRTQMPLHRSTLTQPKLYVTISQINCLQRISNESQQYREIVGNAVTFDKRAQ